MSLIDLMCLGLSSNLRYHQIEGRSLYEKIRENVSQRIVGTLPPKYWNDLSLGLWEVAVVETFRGSPGGVRLDEQHFNWHLYRKNLLAEDADDMIQDGVVYLNHQIMSIVPKTVLEYKCGYKLLANMNILVGIDERDFWLPDEDKDFPFEELFHED